MIKIRKYRNPRRGTELVYATVPIEKVRDIRETELEDRIRQFYGSDIDLSDAGRLKREITAFALGESKESLIVWLFSHFRQVSAVNFGIF